MEKKTMLNLLLEVWIVWHPETFEFDRKYHRVYCLMELQKLKLLSFLDHLEIELAIDS